jgi:hypothetical protein
MGDIPSGYNPNSSVFQGGESVPITPMSGGAFIDTTSPPLGQNPNDSVFKGGESVPITPMEGGQQQLLSDVKPAEQSSIISAAVKGLTVASLSGATPEVAASEGIKAAIKTHELNNLNNVKISDNDQKLLNTVRSGEESEGAKRVANDTYTNLKASGKSDEEATAYSVRASINYIKNYRKTNPYPHSESLVSTEYTEEQAKKILSTPEQKEQEVGIAAYKLAYNKAKKGEMSDRDAAKYAIIQEIKAIDEYRKNIATQPVDVNTLINEKEAGELLLTDDTIERDLGEHAADKAVKDALKDGVRDEMTLEKIGTIAAAERIQSYRADNNEIPVPRKINSKSSMLPLINDIKNLPLYIEYNGIGNELKSPYLELLEKMNANLRVGNEFPRVMKQKIANYQDSQIKLWTDASTINSPVLPQTTNNINFSRQQNITSFSRLTHILPITTTDIIVLPPMDGNLEMFVGALQALDQMGIINSDFAIKENTVIICTVPFYTTTIENIGNNSNLLSIVLDIKRINKDQFFVLSDTTSDGYFVGSRLIGRTGKDILINMMEPSYVIYPYRRKGIEGILISNSKAGASLPGDIAINNKFSLTNIYGSKHFGKTIMKVYKPDLKVDNAGGYFTVLGSLDAMKVPKEKIGDCGLSNYSLGELMQTLHPSKKLKLSYNVKGTRIILGFRLQVKNVYEPLCVRDIVLVKETQNKFISSPEAVTDRSQVTISQFELAGEIFEIRKTNKHDIVYNNWKNGIYSQSEADLLNTLNLKPSIMDKIFPILFDEKGVRISTPWKEWVANFLSTITVKDKSLRTHRETMIVRNFLERVNAYFTSKGLIRDLDESDSDDERPKQSSLSEPSDIGFSSIEKDTYTDIKHEYGTIEIYQDEEKNEWLCSLILVNKQTYKQMYRTIGVPVSQYTNITAKSALQDKINKLRKKYPDWIIIY